jgi:hypothetical protein
MAAPLDRCSFTPIGPPWPGFAPLNHILHSSLNISTPLAHPAIPLRHYSFPNGTPLFPPNSSYWYSIGILIYCKLTPQFKAFWYPKSSQMTLDFNFTHLPDANDLEIQGAPPASLRRRSIVCSCVCRPWWDGWLSGLHWDYLWLTSFNGLVMLLFWF